MQNPSLVVVPYRYKATKLYSEIPITGVGDFTVGRLLDTATRVNSNGNIEVVNANIPRLDYYTSGGTAGCPALLVEPSAQNVVVQSQNWLASGWRSDASSNVTTLTGTTGTLDPLGTNTANSISPTVASGTHLKVSNDGTASYTGGTIYTFTGFFKQGIGIAGRYVQVTPPITAFNQQFYANFDLQLGTIAATGSVSGDTNRASSIESYGNGWYRCRITSTCSTAITGGVGFVANLITASGDTRSPSFTGVTGDVLYGWGAQVETGSVATSYIPTTTGSVTRNADVISVSGAVSGLIGQSEGTIYAEVDFRSPANAGAIIQLDSGDSTNRIIIGAGATINIGCISGGSSYTLPVTGSFLTGINKVAVSYSSSNFTAYLNGVQIGSATPTAGTFPANLLTQFNIGSRISGGVRGAYLNDRIRAVALYTSRLDDADLMVLTSPTYYSNVRDMIWDTFVARTSTFSEIPGCLQTRHNELITL
jgi:hypothetical protein